MIDYIYSDAFNDSAVSKNIIIRFSGMTLDNNDIHSESLKIIESLCSSDNLAFGSCESSECSFTIGNNVQPLIGQTFTLEIVFDEDEDNPFMVGTYKVVSDKLTADRSKREITAFDAIYDINSMNVASWYNSLTFPLTLKSFRDSFFNYVGIEQENVTLCNDSLMIDKTIDAEDLSGSRVITSICEINGAFGHIGRNNTFKYVFFNVSTDALYPSELLYPSGTLFPIKDESYALTRSKYKSCVYEDFEVSRINKVQIRENADDIGVISGTGTNALIIEDNFLIYGLSTDEKQPVADNVYSVVNDITYTPAKVVTSGNLCVEVGDFIKVSTPNFVITFYALERTFSGITSMQDAFIADGTETRPEMVNGVTKDIIQLKGKTNELSRDIEHTQSLIKDVEDGFTSRIEQTDNSILLEVERAQREESDIRSLISINDNEIILRVEQVEKELGGEVQTYYVDYVPTLTNVPAMDWCTNIPSNGTVQLGDGVQFRYTNEDWARNSRSTIMDRTTNISYRLKKVDGEWAMVEVAEGEYTEVLKQLSELKVAQDSIQSNVEKITWSYASKSYVTTTVNSQVEQWADVIQSNVSYTYATQDYVDEFKSSITQTSQEIKAEVSSKAESKGGDYRSFGWSLTDSAFVLNSNGTQVFACSRNGITVKGYTKTTELDAQIARIDTIESNYISANTVSANYATIGSLNAQKGRIDTIESNYISAYSVSTNYATIGALDAVSATVNSINANYVSAGTVDTKIANAGFLKAGDLSAAIANLSGVYAGNLYCDSYHVNAEGRGYTLTPKRVVIGSVSKIFITS